jgi:hypothetical protein
MLIRRGVCSNSLNVAVMQRTIKFDDEDLYNRMKDNRITESYREDKTGSDYNIWNEVWFMRLGEIL